MQYKQLISRFIAISLSLLAITPLLLSSCSKEKKALPKPPQTTPATITAKPTVTPEGSDYCPQAQTLVKTNLRWSGPGGWQGNSPSFSGKIIRFEGAQWKGIRNGKILCIYQGNNDDFPIILQTNRFQVQPQGPTWTKGATTNRVEIYNCVSTDPSQCPFPKSVKIYDPNAAPDPFQALEKKS